MVAIIDVVAVSGSLTIYLEEQHHKELECFFLNLLSVVFLSLSFGVIFYFRSSYFQRSFNLKVFRKKNHLTDVKFKISPKHFGNGRLSVFIC